MGGVTNVAAIYLMLVFMLPKCYTLDIGEQSCEVIFQISKSKYEKLVIFNTKNDPIFPNCLDQIMTRIHTIHNINQLKIH